MFANGDLVIGIVQSKLSVSEIHKLYVKILGKLKNLTHCDFYFSNLRSMCIWTLAHHYWWLSTQNSWISLCSFVCYFILLTQFTDMFRDLWCIFWSKNKSKTLNQFFGKKQLLLKVFSGDEKLIFDKFIGVVLIRVKNASPYFILNLRKSSNDFNIRKIEHCEWFLPRSSQQEI